MTSTMTATMTAYGRIAETVLSALLVSLPFLFDDTTKERLLLDVVVTMNLNSLSFGVDGGV